MKKKYKPYVVVETSVYFTDGVAEELIYTFDSNDIAETVSILLNDAYNGAYEDGLNTSLNEKYNKLVDEITSLSMHNIQLKHQLNQGKDR